MPPDPVQPARTAASAPPRPAVAATRPATVTRTNVYVAPASAQTLRPTLTPVPMSDPTYIPGLMPAPVVGPPVPLAPSQPYANYSAPAAPPVQETIFAYDALVKEVTLKPGEQTAYFTFSLTNTSSAEATINAVRTSCGCTVAKLPSIPWKLAPKSSGSFDVTVDMRGKSGTLTKTVTIDSSAGYRYLSVRVTVPAGSSSMASADRARNLQVALADRQAVFKGDCAACHWQQAVGKHGEGLFKNTCSVCHEAEHRASMVPNLRALNKPTDREFWRNWITHGKDGTLMPAWSAKEGGPLNDTQIESLLDYLTGPFKNEPATGAKPPATAALPAR